MTQLRTYIGTKVIQAAPAPGANGAEGYRVVYSDGYTSWSPKEAFEQAYRLTDSMTFGDALVMLKAGRMVKRPGVEPVMLLGDANSAVPLLLHRVEFQEEPGDPGPGAIFEPSLHDMLAEDWQVVE